ncbi:MAG: sugar phosphate nucleotidyltransferase [candidate division Zixibacteria bacterium]|nr:sugar phosphate nucleotidyltransferase [candidate division Zixibacteria bacterium]
MKVIIPVAGEGTRLRPHTHSAPKPLLSVAGKPILAHVLDPVVPLEPDEVVFVIGYRGDQIRQFVADSYSFKATFVQQDQLLGLGYAVNLAMERIAGGPLMIVLGDTVVQCDLKQFRDAGDYVLGLRQVEDPRRFGIAELGDGAVVRLVEKPEDPPTNLAVIGVYYFSDCGPLKRALDEHVRSGRTVRGEIQLTDALEMLIRSGHRCTPFEVQGWYDCGKRETLLETNRALLELNSHGPKSAGSHIVPPVYIGRDVVLERATIGPHVSIGDGAIVKDSRIRDSIVGRRAVIEGCELGESLVGNEARVCRVRGQVNLGDHSEVELA